MTITPILPIFVSDLRLSDKILEILKNGQDVIIERTEGKEQENIVYAVDRIQLSEGRSNTAIKSSSMRNVLIEPTDLEGTGHRDITISVGERSTIMIYRAA